mgnify:FL=1
METKKTDLQFRGKKTEIHFQSTNQGINICSIGDTNIFDTLTFVERNLILLHIISLKK